MLTQRVEKCIIMCSTDEFGICEIVETNQKVCPAPQKTSSSYIRQQLL
jgi:hypothetical protein